VRPIRIVILAFSALLLVAGGAMAYMSTVRGKVGLGIDLSQPRHPVTSEMAARVLNLNRKLGKFFKLPDTTGKPVVIGGQGPRPQFLYFVKKGCPCSFDAEPIMQSLYRHFEGKIDFVAVSDAGFDDAKKWAVDMKVPYPVVTNPKLDVMEAYQAPGSVYNTLLDQNGLIVKRWAGYSQDYLVEMNIEMSKLINEKPIPFDTAYAPKNRTSGCSFEGYKETKE
jgi:peroxiredoxin